MTHKISNGDYIVEKKLGSGLEGDVFKVSDGAGKSYALKKFKCKKDAEWEYNIFCRLQKCSSQKASFPKVYYFGSDKQEKSKNVIIMSLLSQDLDDIKKNRTLTPKEILLVARQLILMIRDLHYLGYVHNDIKPSNIMAWKSGNLNKIALIDFGLMGSYKDSTGKHYPMENLQVFYGTYPYASASGMRMFRRSRRDDMISIIYTLVDLRRGALPWGEKAYSSRQATQMCRHKENISVSDLCDAMPESIRHVAETIFSLGYSDEPEYETYLREIESDI